MIRKKIKSLKNEKLTITPKSLKEIHVPTKDNDLLVKVLKIINKNEEISALWKVCNVHALNRLGMSDHGPVHFQIVANSALRISRILHKHGVEMSITKDFGLPVEYAELVVLLASLLHDTGMSIDRENHEEFSLFITNNLLREMLTFLSIETRTIIISEVLHAIINHRSKGRPFTIEGGIVRVADALDMTHGRSRIPYEAGKVSIYSVSALAIDTVEISEGTEKPVNITITMNNSAGIFQVDEFLKRKLESSPIEKYLKVKAFIKGQTERSLIKDYIFK